MKIEWEIDELELAKFMHNEYEKLAKFYGWNTKDNCKVGFEELPKPNRDVMIELSKTLITWFNEKLKENMVIKMFEE